MQERFSSGNYTPTGSLAFMKDWQTVLTDEPLQISMVSPTGAKEAHDLGYTLRTRYPQLYNEGDDFVVWANNYTRVIQTAKMFVQGYLGFTTAEYGSVVSVTSTGYTGNIGNSLAPSDQCPLFLDTSGGDYATDWADVYIPPIQERLQALIQGNLTLEASDISQIPYLCGFESQITGQLSPWCNVFTDEELKQYEYAQDIRYWYGLGPGTDLEQTMMMPFLNTLVGLLEEGPGINGTAADGSSYTLPNLLVSFLNDGQLVELISATGVFDNQTELSGTEITDSLFIASHFVTMRGTVAFERLNCIVDGSSTTGTSSTGTGSSSSGSSSGSGSASSGSSGSSPGSELWSGSGSSGSGSGSGSVSEVVTTITTIVISPVTQTTAIPVTYTVTVSDSSSSSGSGSGSGNGNSVEVITKTSLSTYVTSVPVTKTLTITETVSASATGWNATGPLVTRSNHASGTGYIPRPTAAAHGVQRRLTNTTYVPASNTTSSGNATYIRIRLNDAVYTIPSCKNGPGQSCLLSDYVDYVSSKYAAEGNWAQNCNVTTAGAPTTVQGASFFTDLTSPWLQQLTPY